MAAGLMVAACRRSEHAGTACDCQTVQVTLRNGKLDFAARWNELGSRSG